MKKTDYSKLPVQIDNTQIIRCEVITVPEARFIGKHFDGYPNWGEAWANGWFEKIEAMGEQSPINDRSYCVLYGKDNNHWIGEFMEPGTPASEGLDIVDIPETRAVLFFIKGKESDFYGKLYDTTPLYNQIDKLGLPRPNENNLLKYFERENCPRFTTPDKDGFIIVDYIVFLD